MKKIALLLFVLGITFSATTQPYLTIREQAAKEKTTWQVIENSNRSTPPGYLLYSQPFNCPPINGIRSETIGANNEAADDFILSATSSIDIVRWWFFVGDDPTITNWKITIYNNINCLPSNLVATWTIPVGDLNYEFVCSEYGMQIYDYWATLVPNFSAQANEHYWISIQAIGTYDYWCCHGSNYGQIFNCESTFRSVGNNIPEFVPLSQLVFSSDFTFELYSSAQNPVETPISYWALGIGIFLILGFAVLRFRKMA